MKEVFMLMYYSYYGEKDNRALTEEQLESFRRKANEEFRKNKNKMNAMYPVFVKLFDHMRTALDGNAKLACRHLRDALTEYDKINNLPVQSGKAKRKSYSEFFGIDRNFILSFYQSETSRSLNLVQDAPCEPGADVPDNIPDESDGAYIPPSPVPVDVEGPIEKLEKLLSRGLVDSLFEIHQLVKGDGRIIPGQNGVPYGVTFKNAKTKEILYFAGGEYVIPYDVDTNPKSRWEAFSPAIQAFSELVVAIMQDYGDGAYHVFVQGSADSVTFRPKNFHPTYNDPEFHTIDMLSIDRLKQKATRKTVKVGNQYINPDLPQLRASFVRCCLLATERLKVHPDKVTIVEGSVKPFTSPDKRNCSIILYIDWEKAKAAEKTKKTLR
jgi:hypothetical protein